MVTPLASIPRPPQCDLRWQRTAQPIRPKSGPSPQCGRRPSVLPRRRWRHTRCLSAGSGHLFGGRGVQRRPVLGARAVQEMKFPDARELEDGGRREPRRVYGARNSSQRLAGNVAGYPKLANATASVAARTAKQKASRRIASRNGTLAGVINGISFCKGIATAPTDGPAIEIARESIRNPAFNTRGTYKIADCGRE